jgi:hypothetical protein
MGTTVSNSGEFQKVGTEEVFNRKAVYSPSADPPSGQYQKVGDEVKLSHQCVNKTWNSPYQGELPVEKDLSAVNLASHVKKNRGHGRKSKY